MAIFTLAWSPVVALLVGVVLLLLTDALLRERARDLLVILSTLILVVSAVLVAYVSYDSADIMVAGQTMFTFNSFYLAFSLIGLLSSIIIVFSAWKDMSIELDLGVFFSLLLLANAGGLLIASSRNFIPLYVGYELVSIPTYALIAFRKKDRGVAEAGLKVFLLGAISSAFIIYGLAYYYGATGTFFFGADLLSGGSNSFQLIAVGLIAAGSGFKIGLVPFHLWIPDAYSGAPLSVVNFLAASSKKMAFAFVFQLFFFGMGAAVWSEYWGILFAVLATLSMVVGNIAAVIQDRLLRLLAYSTVAQAGYIAIGIAAFAYAGGDVSVQEAAFEGILFHIIAHVLMKGAAVAAVLLVIDSYDGNDHIDNFRGLLHKNPLVGGALAIAMFSLMGIPPLAGFFGKFLLFLAAVEAKITWLAIIGVIGSAISIYYYGRVIRTMAEKPEDDVVIRTHPGINFMLALLTILTFVLVFFGDAIVQLARDMI